MKKYYVYTHYRPDRQEIFYVGVGTRTKTDFKYGKYTRANSKCLRSNFWKAIVTLNPDYSIKIELESDSREEILAKEIELIKLYGRRDLKTGTLCNLTEGGEGTCGFIFPDELREKWSFLAKQRAKFGKENHSSKKVYQYGLNGRFIKEWACKEDVKRELGFNPTGINACCKGRSKTAFNFQWRDEFLGEVINPINKGKTKKDGYLDFKDTRYKKKQ